jgi:hypothetical protein
MGEMIHYSLGERCIPKTAGFTVNCLAAITKIALSLTTHNPVKSIASGYVKHIFKERQA